jgi:hypothetical protein
MEHRDFNPRLEQLIREIILDGEARREELNRLLRENEEARPIAARVFVEDAALISTLRLESIEQWAEALQPRPIPSTRGSSVKWRKARRFSAAAAAIAACFVAVVSIRHFRQTPDAGEIVVNPRGGDWIGWMRRTDANGCESQPESVWRGGKIDLPAGRARVDLGNGVVISVTGPAELRVSLNECRLWSGQVTVDVPKHLKSYVVQTDTGRFVDLGTTFSVATQPGQQTEMAVLSGMVRAERLSYEGDVLSEQLVHKEEGVVLDHRANEIRTVSAGALKHQEPILPKDTPLVVPDAYRTAVEDSKPFIYWDFDTFGTQGMIANRAGGGFQGIRRGDLQTGGGHIVLGESEGSIGWIESTEPWRKEDREPFTIEMWARPDRIHWGLLTNLRIENELDPVTGHKPIGPLSYFSMEVTHNRVFPTMPEAPSFRCSFRSPATEHPQSTIGGGVNAALASPGRYVPGKWHHLAARMDHEFTLFIDGEVVAKTPLSRPDMGLQELHFLVGSMHYQLGNSRQFVGAIDEFAAYRRALDDEEIRAHFMQMGNR